MADQIESNRIKPSSIFNDKDDNRMTWTNPINFFLDRHIDYNSELDKFTERENWGIHNDYYESDNY